MQRLFRIRVGYHTRDPQHREVARQLDVDCSSFGTPFLSDATYEVVEIRPTEKPVSGSSIASAGAVTSWCAVAPAAAAPARDGG